MSIKRKLSSLNLKQKFVIIALCMVLIRIGSAIPLPFVNHEYMTSIMQMSGLSFFNSITGGSMQQMSLFALSISPYITASIIIQLLGVAIPALDEIKKDGKTGQDKYKMYIRLTGIGLAFVQAVAMAVGLGAKGLLNPYNAGTVIGSTIIWTVGAAVIILIGEFIDQMEVGNGISFILISNIAASIPSDIQSIKEVFLSSQNAAVNVTKFGIVFGVFFLLIAACVILTSTEKRIKISQTRKMNGFANHTFPIPLNTCSVMPVIFASSIMSFPIIIAQFFPSWNTGVAGHIISCLNSSMWFRMERPWYTVGAIFYVALTSFFTTFYLGIGFNTYEIADNFKKSGTVIPGIRAGKPTAEYLGKISQRIALLGNFCMTALILIMHLICNASGIGTLSIAGTSMIICVSVIAEERKLLKSLLAVNAYHSKSFLFTGSKVAA